MDSTQQDLDALTTIIGALKKMPREEQSRTMQAVSVFLGLNSDPVRTQHTAGMTTHAPKSAQANEPTSKFSEDRGASPKEFLRDKKPASDVERVACLAYYLTHHRDIPHFKTVDISALNTVQRNLSSRMLLWQLTTHPRRDYWCKRQEEQNS